MNGNRINHTFYDTGTALILPGSILLAIFLFWSASVEVVILAQNQTPTEMSLSSYQHQGSMAQWVKLTKCELRMEDSLHCVSKGRIEEIYIPLRIPNGNPQDAPRVVLATQNRDLIEWTARMSSGATLEHKKDYAQKKNLPWVQIKDVQGMVRDKNQGRHHEFDEITSLGKLAPNIIVIAEGEEPNAGKAIMFGILGLATAVYAYRRWREHLKPNPLSRLS